MVYLEQQVYVSHSVEVLINVVCRPGCSNNPVQAPLQCQETWLPSLEGTCKKISDTKKCESDHNNRHGPVKYQNLCVQVTSSQCWTAALQHLWGLSKRRLGTWTSFAWNPPDASLRSRTLLENNQSCRISKIIQWIWWKSTNNVSYKVQD